MSSSLLLGSLAQLRWLGASAARLSVAAHNLPTFAFPGLSTSAASCSESGEGAISSAPSTSQPASKPSSAASAGPKPALVDAYLSTDNKNKPGVRSARKQEIIARFQRFPGDVGSSEVQIALLTQRIRDMDEHFITHRKDVHARRNLRIVLNQRRALLTYLRRTDFERYAATLHALGLKDIYGKQAHDDNFRVGTSHSSGSEPVDRYGKKRAHKPVPTKKR